MFAVFSKDDSKPASAKAEPAPQKDDDVEDQKNEEEPTISIPLREKKEDEDIPDSKSLVQSGVATRTTGNCCSEKFDSVANIVSVVCLYIMSIFFIVGGSFSHPDNMKEAAKLDEPLTFFFLGTVAFIAVGILDVIKRKSKGGLEIAAGTVGLFGGSFWFIGSIFLFQGTMDLTAWGGLWIIGSMCNLYVATYDIVMTLRSQVKPLFRTIGLALAWLANLLFLGGAASFIDIESEAKSTGYYDFCDLTSGSGLLIAAGVLYFIHSIFYTLALFLGDLIFTIQVSRSPPAPSE